MQDFPTRTSIRGNKNRSSWCLRRPHPPTPLTPTPSPFIVQVMMMMTAKQPPRRQDAILFLLCVHQTIILSRKHLFKYTSVTACVGYMVKKMANVIVYDCIRFLFLFSKFYIELCISQIMRSFSRSVIYV